VQPLDVGTAREMTRRSRKDGMSPDHIPSFAAIKKALEAKLGRTLTRDEAKSLRDSTNTIVYPTGIHQQNSRTYGGRNYPKRVLQDSEDLRRAFIEDVQRIRPYLIKSGYTPQQVDDAIQKLDAMNKASGLY
jgi:hypothetical protein